MVVPIETTKTAFEFTQRQKHFADEKRNRPHSIPGLPSLPNYFACFAQHFGKAELRQEGILNANRLFPFYLSGARIKAGGVLPEKKNYKQDGTREVAALFV